MTHRIAMWSGPRNISTAMMRSWENRVDCSVIDEPFYAFYLNRTQSPHPMFDAVVNSQPTEFNQVATQLSKRPCNTPLQYQKHMTHHMLDNCDLAWTKNISHCFLIREPAYVINSYTNSRGECNSDDIGIVRQYQLYQAISRISGQNIPVIDSLSVLRNPNKVLSALCERLGVSFSTNMLTWPPGRRDSDGVWAEHWYQSVEKSTHFSLPLSQSVTLSAEQQRLADQLQPYYQALKEHELII